MISESERRIRILDYVRKNYGKITKSDVMRHMEQVSDYDHAQKHDTTDKRRKDKDGKAQGQTIQ